MESKIPKGWEKIKLGEVVEHVKDKVPNRDDWTFDRYIGGEHFNEGEIRITKSAPIEGNEEVIGSAFHMRFKPGQVLYVTRNPRLRKGGVVDFEGVCSNVTFTLQADENKLSQKLLPFIIQTESFTKHACNSAHGSTNPFLNWKDIASYDLLLPPISEQKRISDLLWAIEEAIKCNEQIILFNNKLRNKLLNKLFDNHKTENIELSQLIIDGARNGVYKPREFKGKGIKMVNMGEIFRYPLINNQEMERIELNEKELQKDTLKEGDLIFARRSLVVEGAGKCSMIGKLSEPMTFESSIIRIRPDKQKINPYFLLYFFKSKHGREVMGKIIRHVAVAGITGSDLVKLKIPYLDLSKQNRIVNIIQTTESNIQSQNQNLNSLKSLRQKLMNELLLGKIRLEK